MDEFRRIWGSGEPCYNYNLIDNPDNQWYTYTNPEGKNYALQIFRFQKPSGYTAGTLRWRVRGKSGADVFLYRWRHVEDSFVKIDENDGGSNPPTRQVTVPASWFSGEGVFFVMAVVETSPGNRAIDCDVVDIQY